MMPGTIKTDSQVHISDSCNNCCCLQWRRKNKAESKAALQAPKISKQESPRRAERSVTELHLDMRQTDDVVFVQGYSVAHSTVVPPEEEQEASLFESSMVIDPTIEK